MLADYFADALALALAYGGTPFLLAAPVLAATTTIVVVVFACRSSMHLPAAWGTAAMELYSPSGAWWPDTSHVWLPLPTLSQFTVPKAAFSTLDFQSVLKMLNLLEVGGGMHATPAAAKAPPSPTTLQRRSVTAHRLVVDESDVSDSDDERDEVDDYDADCESSDERAPRGTPATVFPSPLHVGRCPGAPSAVDAEPCPAYVAEVVPDSYLLQFGALIGEHDAIQALHNNNLPWAWSPTGERCVFGAMEGPCDPSRLSWEPCGEGASSTASFQCWRMPLRSGYCMWLSANELVDVAAEDVARFNLHNRTRFLWDDTAMIHETLDCADMSTTTTPNALNHAWSCVQQYRCRYPTPMAARQYVYARRVWRRPRDGAYYIISHACAPPAAGLAVPHGRVCPITDYVSCMCIAPVVMDDGRMGTRVVNVYFEDPSTPPSVTNMAIRKGLWQFTQRHERALREHTARAAAQMLGGGDAAAEGGGGDEDVYDRVLANMCADGRRRGGGLRRVVSSGGRLVAGVSSRALRPLALLTAPPTVRSRMATVMVVGLLRGVVAAGERQ